MPTAEISCVLLPPWTDRDVVRAGRLGVPAAERAAAGQWTLRRTAAGHLELCAPAALGGACAALDPGRGPLLRRLLTARRDQPLPRAVGLHRRSAPPRVVDATAGLGRDALVLAALGCRVLAFERIAPLVLLLEDAAARAGVEERLTVHHGDALAALEALAAGGTAGTAMRPDAVFLDPMFAAAGAAQVKKEMQVARLLAGAPDPPGPLLDAALAAARERVVVKRHPRLAPLREGPSFTVSGERVRFDVYLVPGSGLTAGT